MKPEKAFFLADGILALGVILLGTAAIQAIHLTTVRARYDHQIRQRAWQILKQGSHWAPVPGTYPWEREFDFQGVPVPQGGVFWMKATETISDQTRYVRHEVSYFDGSEMKQTLLLETSFLEVDHEGL